MIRVLGLSPGEQAITVYAKCKLSAESTISGAIAGWRPHDQRGHAMYCDALSELANLIEKQHGED